MQGNREMNAKTRKALEGSIEKWQMIAYKGGMDNGSQNCPLCGLYFAEFHCKGCPVAKHTGDELCYGTPYEAWGDHQNQTHYSDDHFVRDDCSKCKKLAQAELKFLRSLRPRKKKKKVEHEK